MSKPNSARHAPTAGSGLLYIVTSRVKEFTPEIFHKNYPYMLFPSPPLLSNKNKQAPKALRLKIKEIRRQRCPKKIIFESISETQRYLDLLQFLCLVLTFEYWFQCMVEVYIWICDVWTNWNKGFKIFSGLDPLSKYIEKSGCMN